MKLAAIYNVWDGVELLKGSIKCIREHVDLVIIVWQNVSNFGEAFDPLQQIEEATGGIGAILYAYEPDLLVPGFTNEKAKRNIGLEIAREQSCSHFLFMDCDEYWEDFGQAKADYLASNKEGSVCELYTYFKKPTWRLEYMDNYYVPFIHKLHTHTQGGKGPYPFYVDPTRKVPVNGHGVALLRARMHHFSYVRQDIERKCRNSSARNNIERSQLLKDYHDPACGPGFYIADFRQKLIEVPNLFNINL